MSIHSSHVSMHSNIVSMHSNTVSIYSNSAWIVHTSVAVVDSGGSRPCNAARLHSSPSDLAADSCFVIES